MTTITTNNLIAAIDLGTTKVVTLVAKANPDGKFDIIGLSTTPSQGIVRGSIQNISDTATAMRRTIDEVQAQTGTTIKAAYVGIAGDNIHYTIDHSSLDIAEGMVSAAHLQTLDAQMRTRATTDNEQLLHVLPHSYMIDGVSCEHPEGKTGKRLDGNFLMVKSNRVSVKAIEQCLSISNLKAAGVMLEPLASAEAVLTEEEKMAGVALVDIGGGTTDIAIYHGGKCRYSSVVTDGGQYVTNDIRAAFQVTEAEAEQLKVQYGCALATSLTNKQNIGISRSNGQADINVPQAQLAGVIQARMDSIWNCIQLKIEEAGFTGKLGAGLVITGGGALLKHLPQLFKFRASMPTRIGLPMVNLASNSTERFNTPQFSTALGLVKMAMLSNSPIAMVEANNSTAPQPEPAPAPNKPAPQPKTNKKKKGFSLKNIGNMIQTGAASLFGDDNENEAFE